ncbi:alpha/beta hydrolase [Azotobacter beijerinckii]|uniref:alpha/beta hydrolase n=1 Tax=Azotobacter beijerinckii TaxID=170623 RepID=UPI0029533656|nr:alpha/beta hydrolase [Azotobacter beijerinckii]MDV7210198.1 alpha/beta hydrolase [Azotobacter beijerinckii]
MGSPSLHPYGTQESRTEQTLTSGAKVRDPGAVSSHEHRALALFIGGAGDKKPYYLAGPYRNICYAQAPFDRRIEEAGHTDGYQSLYLGYHEVWSASAIGRLVVTEVHDKTTPIYIVGHSIGAWNGAHLSQRLSEWGYRVEMLVTLDPVGSGLLVRLGSRIPYHRPAPRSRCWINVRAEPGRSNASDLVAQLGRKWHVAGEPDIDEALDTNHANAWALFCKPLHDGRSAADRMFESIVGLLRD